MPEEKPKMVTANIRYARVVIMETTKEVLESDFDDTGNYIGPDLECSGLPGVYSGLTEEMLTKPLVPDHVDDIVDYDVIWEVTKEE